MKRAPRGRGGQTLVAAVLMATAALVIVPLLVFSVQNEARWTVKQDRSTLAYHLAEAGQDRAVAFLAASDESWSQALAGTPAPGYAGDVQYSDVAGGLYTISLSSGPLADQVTVLTKGRDAGSKEVRAIQAVYGADKSVVADAPLLSGFIAQGPVGYQSTMHVYWGAITSYTGLTVSGTPPPYHPLKISKGSISPWDASPTPPNADPSKGYSAYDPTLTTPPQLDFDRYRALAKATVLPDPQLSGGSRGSQTAAWRGTGYFDAGSKPKEVDFKNYVLDCSTCVIFIERDNAKLEGSGYMHIAALIVHSGNIHIHNSGANPYVVSVPTAAWQQYTAGTAAHPQSPDTAAVDEYPGDGGYRLTKPTYSIPTAAFDGVGNTGMAFHGLLYSYSFNCSGGNNTLVGQFLIGPGGTKVNTIVLYYDPSVAIGGKYKDPTVLRRSWREVVASWP